MKLNIQYFSKNSFIFQSFVPDFMKDDRYWNKRKKNNEAARVSRENKRRKENQIVMRAAFLEEENSNLKIDVDKINQHNAIIRKDVQNLASKLGQFQQFKP